MSERPAKELDKIIVRLPDGMRARLSEIAKANNRSVNAEVVARLEKTLSQEVDEANRYVEMARESFEDAFRVSLKAATKRLHDVMVEEPELLLHKLHPPKKDSRK